MNLRRFVTLFASAVLVLRSLLTVRAGETAEEGLRQMKRLVRTRFPEVRQLSAADLAAWLADTNRMPPLLLDVRTGAEFAVSHLPGARRADPKATAAELLPTLPAERPIVVYCSVGYRSSELAARLLRAGRTNVANLEGSIFAWANEGRPLERNGRPVATVHPYNEQFGRLLKPELRAANPEAPK
jgi:rhodanese-related sulfurtransferase